METENLQPRDDSEEDYKKAEDYQEETPEEINTSSENLDIKTASDYAKKKLGEALQKKPHATISISQEGNEWHAIVEVVEEEYLPGMNLRSMNDIIGVYEIILDSQGRLTKWEKKTSHKRGIG
jgi:hypothetical protein